VLLPDRGTGGDSLEWIKVVDAQGAEPDPLAFQFGLQINFHKLMNSRQATESQIAKESPCHTVAPRLIRFLPTIARSGC
jgi:hypothetical protein